MKQQEEQQGWIKLYRQLLNNPIHSKPEWLSVWIHLLLMASHEEKSFIWNGQKITLKPGQFVTGRLKIAENAGVSASLVERVLKYLEIEQQIEQQKTNKFRLITIKKWSEYQKSDSSLDNKRTTSGQQADTFKNDKNVKERGEGEKIPPNSQTQQKTHPVKKKGIPTTETLALIGFYESTAGPPPADADPHFWAQVLIDCAAARFPGEDPVAKVKRAIKATEKNTWHKKMATSLQYIYNHFDELIKQSYG